MSDMGALESRYRMALRAYPSRWRAKHGEELLGVMLDVAADEDRSKASVSEVLHVAFHGMGARVNQVLSVVPRRRRDRLAAVGLIAGTSLALVMMVLGELGRWFRQESYTFVDDPFGPVTTPAAFVFFLALAAFLAQAAGRYGLAKSLQAVTVMVCVALATVMKTTDQTIVVPVSVFGFFAVMSLLALVGNPTRTPRLRQLVLGASPLLGLVMIFTSFLQGAGAQRTFWRPNDGSGLDGYSLARSSAEIVLIAALITLSGQKVRPWACLVLISLAARPLTAMFWMLGSSDPGQLIGIQPDVFKVACVLVALFSAWLAWKRPVITYPGSNSRPLPG